VIQEQIRQTVRQMVNADIDRQSDVDLMLVMRSYYLQYGGDTMEELNERVVNFCSNRIAVEVEAYRYYRADILDFPAPIAHPLQTNVYGTRTGELKRFF
jgi:chromosome condensin MukBEF complex kleisin-like MukF subunit